jgi:hypothetical protein
MYQTAHLMESPAQIVAGQVHNTEKVQQINGCRDILPAQVIET